MYVVCFFSGRLVQQQRVKIMEFYERKEKQIELQKKIQNSNLLNTARLRVLKAREDALRALQEEARQRLASLVRDQNGYRRLLEGLLTQALFQLLEDSVVIRCRQQDVQLVQEVLPRAAQAYKAVANKTVNLTIDKENFLSPDISGGIELYAQRGKIRIENTLESRIDMISQQMLPELRQMLFGANPNRKFLD